MGFAGRWVVGCPGKVFRAEGHDSDWGRKMSDDLKFEGIGISGGIISVYFVRKALGAPRFETVKLPVESLLHDEILHDVYAAAAKRLRLAWETGDPAPALFS